ncbi:MAG TPA: phosphotransferase [Acidimicrobiales bacterium]|nr:phosphotransferase [Acidimicrobiales bacterium]
MRAVWDPEQVDGQWLQDVLTSAGATGDQQITGVDATPIGTGQVGCNIRYRITYDRSGPAPDSVVLKFASRSEDSRAIGIQTLTYETEVAFYRDLAATVDVYRPHCWFAAVEPGTANVVLVLEDVQAQAGDQLAGCGTAEAELAMDEAAKLHGPRWGDPRLLEVPWLAAKKANAFDPGTVLALVWPTFLERYRDALSEESVEVGSRLAAARTWADPGASPLTVCHTDFRLDNMLFADPAGARPLTVVDWQTVQLNAGPADVAYFLSAAMPPEQRRKVERDLLARYYGRLSAYDIGDYDFDHCWSDYRRHSFSGFFMAVFASVAVGRTERGDEMFMTMANGAAAQVVDLGAIEFLA